MPDTTLGNRRRDKQKIPRIPSKEAGRIFADCEHLLDSSGALCRNLGHAEFSRFLGKFDEKILELAVRPDSWGERTRARLIAEVFTGLRGTPAEDASVEEIAQVANVVVPSFLLELGRRKRHIEIEFPANPCDSAARFGLRVGPSCPIHSIDSERLVRLVAEAGEELVGLCYFGDQQSRERIEAELNRTDIAAKSKTPPCRSSLSSETKH